MTEETDRPALSDPDVYDAAVLEADLVMKGGITSGVVFPLAICELAGTYRLRNIGGTSAGAMAAALAAAAELGRKTGGGGFGALAAIPAWISRREPGSHRNNLLRLFQPAPATRSLLELLLAAVGKDSSAARKVLQGLWWVLFGMGAWPWIGLLPGALLVAAVVSRSVAAQFAAGALLLVGAVVFFILRALTGKAGSPWRSSGVVLGTLAAAVLAVAGPLWLTTRLGLADEGPLLLWMGEVALLVLLSGLLTGGVAGIARKVSKAVPANLFGICSGSAEPAGQGAPALTPWLAEKIQALAGRTTADKPVTFEDLERNEPAVTLRVMTTNLTFGRPYLLPFQTGVFYFHPAEFRRLFPKEIVDYLEHEARAWIADPGLDDDACLVNRFMYPRLPLPQAKKLPIVIAARMSLSFPLLLSAVPLWSLDWAQKSNQEASNAWRAWRRDHSEEWRAIRNRPQDLPTSPPVVSPLPARCWFSDGGLCSNFPVHLFDSPLPVRPTFAINLKYDDVKPPSDRRVELVRTMGGGLTERWTALGDKDNRILKFFGAIIGTMQNWTDNTLLKVPGYRDRIAHLHLGPDEGGLNLDMSEDQIAALGAGGREAGQRLVERFTRSATGPEPSWDNHRWTRFRSSLGLLQNEIRDLIESYGQPPGVGRPTYLDLIHRGTGVHPTSYPWSSKRQADLAEETMKKLEELVQLWDKHQADFQDENVPRPRPELQVRPQLSS